MNRRSLLLGLLAAPLAPKVVPKGVNYSYRSEVLEGATVPFPTHIYGYWEFDLKTPTRVQDWFPVGSVAMGAARWPPEPVETPMQQRIMASARGD